MVLLHLRSPALDPFVKLTNHEVIMNKTWRSGGGYRDRQAVQKQNRENMKKFLARKCR